MDYATWKGQRIYCPICGDPDFQERKPGLTWTYTCIGCSTIISTDSPWTQYQHQEVKEK